MKKYCFCILLFVLFEGIAWGLYLGTGNLFYLLNFTYIGGCLALGLCFFIAGKRYARQFIQFAVGTYMLVYLGLLCGENMQIEGFWYYLFRGTFEAAVIHYAVAKIFGPLIFGRGWCGYACWTAMILDLLPYKKSGGRRKKWGFMRGVTFATSLVLMAGFFFFPAGDPERVMLYLFIGGNLLYYTAGIVLAFVLKDNRAFCKYLCPVTVFLKPASYYSLLRIHCDEEKCINCGKCQSVCPMDVEMNRESRRRANATECILCYECVKACPVKALH